MTPDTSRSHKHKLCHTEKFWMNPCKMFELDIPSQVWWCISLSMVEFLETCLVDPQTQLCALLWEPKPWQSDYFVHSQTRLTSFKWWTQDYWGQISWNFELWTDVVDFVCTYQLWNLNQNDKMMADVTIIYIYHSVMCCTYVFWGKPYSGLRCPQELQCSVVMDGGDALHVPVGSTFDHCQIGEVQIVNCAIILDETDTETAVEIPAPALCHLDKSSDFLIFPKLQTWIWMPAFSFA